MYLIRRQKGFSLIEVLIALAINAFLFAALITLFVDNLGHYRKTTNLNRFNEQMLSAMQYMVTDIRRAGYWGNASSDVGTHLNNNPFMAVGTDITVTGGNCILFSYDSDNNGTLPSVSASYNDERFGFRLDNQTIQARPPGATYACNAASNAWTNLTDPTLVLITALTFVVNQTALVTGPGTKGITLRSVDISMTGQLTSDSTITKTLTEHVRIGNDKFIP